MSERGSHFLIGPLTDLYVIEDGQVADGLGVRVPHVRVPLEGTQPVIREVVEHLVKHQNVLHALGRNKYFVFGRDTYKQTCVRSI